MARTIGYHLVKSAYGMWLPGDDRRSWSEAWDEQIGFCHPHTLNAGDPVRHRMAEERMKQPVVRFTPEMMIAITDSLRECVTKSAGGLSITAFAIEETHMHLALPFTGRDIDGTAKWIADQTTKAVHRTTGHAGAVWCKGCWRSFVFEDEVWESVHRYIERHNMRRGLPENIL